MSASGRKLAKRACDGCKIRKIKCTEVIPCEGCVAAGIACTFVKQPSTRGPRRLRKSTLREIIQSQQQWEDLGFGSGVPDEPVVHTRLDAESVFAPNKVAALVLQLCVYRLRMYPVWPIIKVERLVASLQKPEPDIEVFGLAYAVAAATIVRIRAKSSTQPSAVTAEMMEAQCQYAKVRRNRNQPPDLTTVRIPFFLHMYYENLEPGGLRSVTYLREAIAIAHMIGLHRETYYSDVQPEEREIRRRTLWLLFVAERNIAISHKLPVTLRTKIAFPSTIDSDSKHVLAAYQKLVTMFWEFDRCGVFELLDRCDFVLSMATEQTHPPGLMAAMIAMRRKLDEVSIDVESMEDAQAFDLLVTRQWMRIILWRLTQAPSRTMQPSEEAQNTIHKLLEIANDLLIEIADASETAIEVHSSSFESKIFEITISIIDVARGLHDKINLKDDPSETLMEVLTRFRDFLSRNDDLSRKLRDHVVDSVRQEAQLLPSISHALNVAMETRRADNPSINLNTSPRPSDYSASSTDISSVGQTNIARHAYWSPQQGYRDLLLRTPDSLTSASQQVPVQDMLQPPYLDMEWSQYGQSPATGFSEPTDAMWHDMNFNFNGA